MLSSVSNRHLIFLIPEEEMENVSNKPQQQDNSESREHQEHYIGNCCKG